MQASDVAALSAGQSLTKFSFKAGKSARCQVKLSPKYDSVRIGSKTLKFARGDLKRVTLGRRTSTFLQVKSRGLDPSLCFSLCNDERSWDLQAGTVAQLVAVVVVCEQLAFEAGTYDGQPRSRQDILASAGGLAAGVDAEVNAAASSEEDDYSEEDDSDDEGDIHLLTARQTTNVSATAGPHEQHPHLKATAGPHEQALNQGRRAVEHLQQGTDVVKYAEKNGKRQERRMVYAADSQSLFIGSTEIPLADCDGVLIGRLTSSFRRSSIDQLKPKPKVAHCFSLVLEARNFDLEVRSSELAVLWLIGLQALLPRTKYGRLFLEDEVRAAVQAAANGKELPTMFQSQNILKVACTVEPQFEDTTPLDEEEDSDNEEDSQPFASSNNAIDGPQAGSFSLHSASRSPGFQLDLSPLTAQAKQDTSKVNDILSARTAQSLSLTEIKKRTEMLQALRESGVPANEIVSLVSARGVAGMDEKEGRVLLTSRGGGGLSSRGGGRAVSDGHRQAAGDSLRVQRLTKAEQQGVFRVFEVYTSNNSGLVSRAALQDALAALGEPAGPVQLRAMLSSIGVDHRQTFCFADFAHCMALHSEYLAWKRAERGHAEEIAAAERAAYHGDFSDDDAEESPEERLRQSKVREARLHEHSSSSRRCR